MNSQTSQLSTSKSDDEAAIRELYQQMVDGWNRGSGEGFAAPYAEEGVHVGYDGTHISKGVGKWPRFTSRSLTDLLKVAVLYGRSGACAS
jgi:uncharacterized protein (TIGR02246 family)